MRILIKFWYFLNHVLYHYLKICLANHTGLNLPNSIKYKVEGVPGIYLNIKEKIKPLLFSLLMEARKLINERIIIIGY